VKNASKKFKMKNYKKLKYITKKLEKTWKNFAFKNYFLTANIFLRFNITFENQCKLYIF
jgi:hypothetical protein